MTLVAVALAVVLVSSASAAVPTYSNGFEIDTAGWTNDFGGTITRKASGFTNPGGYGSGINSATGGFHARLDRANGSCFAETGGGGQTVQCQGPLTKWGGYNSKWPVGGYTTQLDIYLDAAYATANPDSYGGNMDCLLPNTTDVNCKGTRFDYSSAINNNSGNHLRDFGFNVSTGLANDTCPGFMVIGTTNVDRIGANPNGTGGRCIPDSGWYTFKHTFSAENGFLKVLMQVIPASGGPATASFTISGIDPIATVGCNRYGWFTNQEIWGLPIDNASMTGCGTPPPVVVDPPPIIVLPPEPGPGPPTTPGPGPPVPVPPVPPGDQGGNEIITRNVRSCVIEVRALGPSRVLIARGVARAPAKGAGRLIVRVHVEPKGKTLLSKNFGGVIANVRALCRSTSGTLRRVVKKVRVVLLVEHRLTPPGAWIPDQPILTDIGHSFMNYVRSRMFRVRSIRCDGYTATWPPSPAFPPTLSLNRAKRVCAEMKRVGGAKARARLVPHGRADPIATNSTESGRRVNRRVFVTIVHMFVFRSSERNAAARLR